MSPSEGIVNQTFCSDNELNYSLFFVTYNYIRTIYIHISYNTYIYETTTDYANSLPFYCIVFFYSGELIKDLNSSDDGIRLNALKEANRHIAASDEHCSTKVNKTRINTNPPPLASQVNICTQTHVMQWYSLA